MTVEFMVNEFGVAVASAREPERAIATALTDFNQIELCDEWIDAVSRVMSGEIEEFFLSGDSSKIEITTSGVHIAESYFDFESRLGHVEFLSMMKAWREFLRSCG